MAPSLILHQSPGPLTDVLNCKSIFPHHNRSRCGSSEVFDADHFTIVTHIMMPPLRYTCFYCNSGVTTGRQYRVAVFLCLRLEHLPPTTGNKTYSHLLCF